MGRPNVNAANQQETNMKLFVTMGLYDPNVGISEEGLFTTEARIEIMDWETKKVLTSFEYKAPPENLGERCSLKFTGGCAYKGKWFQATGTEVLVYNPKTWELEQTFTHPSLTDLHGVAVAGDEIALVNTGLEMMQFMNMNGEMIREVGLAPTPTWERFDKNIDYRRVLSTKPHEVHINHAFQLDGEWWVTRYKLKDAIRMDDPNDRIDVAVGHPHDGIVRGDYVYFTTTNANIVIANKDTRKVEEVIDLNTLYEAGDKIGWCRGLEIEGDHAYVGFSRIRRTKWSEAFHWAKDLARGRKRNSHIEKIDLKRKQIVDSHDYKGRFSSNTVFQLMDYNRVVGDLAWEV